MGVTGLVYKCQYPYHLETKCQTCYEHTHAAPTNREVREEHGVLSRASMEAHLLP